MKYKVKVLRTKYEVADLEVEGDDIETVEDNLSYTDEQFHESVIQLAASDKVIEIVELDDEET